MSDLKVCRICLSKGVKVYNYDSFHLKQYYEEIMCKKANVKDVLPNYFCYECAAILYKFHKFKEKCWTGEKTLQQLLWRGSITLSSISQIDRQDKNLQSPIDLITVNERVRTYIIKSKTLSKTLIKKIEIPEIEECELNYDSDNSLDNKNLAEIKNEMINEKPQVEIEKTNVDVEMSKEEKTVPDLEGDRMFSDAESWLESTDDLYKPAIKEEIAIEGNFDVNTEQAQSDDEIALNKNHKEKKRKKTKTNKSFVGEKAKRFEVYNDKKNFLDPKHWLKINLTEEEALEEFRTRALDRKYVSAAYKCTDCYKGFSKEDMLNRHIKLRHSESLGPVVCRFCSMRFKWKCYLTRHITQHYTKYKCLRCDLMCPLKNTALFHNEYHNGVIRKCMHCGEEFRHLSTYYTHLRTHRSEYVCTLCGASFVSTMGLNMHKRTMHINTVVNPEEAVNTYCERCDIKFETRKAYEEHLFHSAKHAEGIEDLTFETPAPSIPKRRKKLLRRNPRKFTPCNICKRNFSSQTAYLKHHSAEHKDEPLPSKEEQRHICEICGASLAAGSVASHLNTHTRERMYTCSTCRMQFNSKGSMTRHQLTHTGEKPYECSMCEKRFTQKCSMKLHYRTFHLKEPYPKRNRRKNAGIQQEIEGYRINEKDSEETQKVDRWR
ncbi:hypothetical protein PYW07_009367 [Mythimna separata]|uniref:Uncharacterized protein n=1 Tax=Mythimna separata TaxID=271217 RepID=A0AAD8DN54_MYTSE|nr:hypothetical protein PYW07_009367 [Mythimna separata]